MKIFLKRILSYLMDIILVSLLVTLLSGTPINPNYKKLEKIREDYTEVYTHYNEALNRVTSIYNLKEITAEDIDDFNSVHTEYSDKMKAVYEDEKINEEEYKAFILDIQEDFLVEYDEYFHEIKRLSIYQDIISIVILILYFVFFAYFTDGQTLGKKLFKLQITSSKDKKLNIGNYLIRSFILNGVVITTLDVILRLIIKGNLYIDAYNYLSTISYILELVIIFSIMINIDKRGIHDLLSGTKVIDLKETQIKTERIEEK